MQSIKHKKNEINASNEHQIKTSRIRLKRNRRSKCYFQLKYTSQHTLSLFELEFCLHMLTHLHNVSLKNFSMGFLGARPLSRLHSHRCLDNTDSGIPVIHSHNFDA
eukprot:1088052_1